MITSSQVSKLFLSLYIIIIILIMAHKRGPCRNRWTKADHWPLVTNGRSWWPSSSVGHGRHLSKPGWKKREEDDSLVTDLEKRINDRQSTREAQKQDRIDKEAAKIAAEKEAKEAKEAAEVAKKEQEAAKKADILSGESYFWVIHRFFENTIAILGGHKSIKNKLWQ